MKKQCPWIDYSNITQGGLPASPGNGPSQSSSSSTISVGTTTTLPAGSNATVTNSGTPTNAILNFGIPKGVDGSSQSGHVQLSGALLNDTGQPSIVAPGSRIPWKLLNKNETGLIIPATDQSSFQFTRTGRYLCVFSLRCATQNQADNGLVNWGLYSLTKNQMLTSASGYASTVITNISGAGIIDITDVTEKFNLVNNSKITIKVQGATVAQVTYPNFADVNSIAIVDAMSCTFTKIA